jgi:hypothetical protein
MQQLNEKDGGDGLFKNGGPGGSGQNRIAERAGDSEPLRNPFFDPPGHPVSLPGFTG